MGFNLVNYCLEYAYIVDCKFKSRSKSNELKFSHDFLAGTENVAWTMSGYLFVTGLEILNGKQLVT